MYIITDWRELQANNDNPLYHSLFNYIFQGVEAHTEENYIEHWMSSTLILIDSKIDKALLSATNQSSFIQAFPIDYQAHIAYLLKYPEFTEKLNDQHYISLAIWEDVGSGIFLLFDNRLKEQCQTLNDLTQESYNDSSNTY